VLIKEAERDEDVTVLELNTELNVGYSNRAASSLIAPTQIFKRE